MSIQFRSFGLDILNATPHGNQHPLPQNLVANFESGVSVETTVHKEPLYGHISGTITVSDKSISKPPDPKKAKGKRLCPKDFEGYVHV